MSAVSQNRVVDKRRVVEALHVELDSVLRSGMKRGRKKYIHQLNFHFLYRQCTKGGKESIVAFIIVLWNRTFIRFYIYICNIFTQLFKRIV